MTDNLEIFGEEYLDSKGIKATDDEGVVHKFYRLKDGIHYLYQNADGYIEITNTMPYASVSGNVMYVPGSLMGIGVIDQITSMEGSTLNVAEGFLERQNYDLILEWDDRTMEGSVIYGDYADVKGILDVGGTPIIKAFYTDSEGETSEIISVSVTYRSQDQAIIIRFEDETLLGLFGDNGIVLE